MAYAARHGKGWQANWQLLEKRADGRYKEKSKSGFPTKRAAEKYAEKQESEIAAGTWVDPKKGATPLGEWWLEWLPAQDLRPNSVETYKQQYSKHIAPRWAAVPLGAIRAVDIDTWIKELRTCVGDSAVTIIKTVMRGLLDSAAFDQLIGRSPMPLPKRGKGAAVAEPPREGVVIPLPVVELLLARMKYDSDRLIILTALFCGMRWSEVAGMRIRYLTLAPAGGGLPASGSYLIDSKEGAVHEDVHARRFYGPPKSGPGRVIDLPPFLVMLLLAHVATLGEKADVLFPDTKGNARQYDTWLNYRWHPACEGRPASVSPKGRSVRAAIAPVCPGLVFHDLKHTCKAIMNDLKLHSAIQDYVLGHIPAGTPGVYSHPTDQMRRDRLGGLERVWAGWTLSWSTPISLPVALEAAFAEDRLF
jgi:integrase